MRASLQSTSRRNELSRCFLARGRTTACRAVSLHRYIAAAASPDIAARYTEAIVSYCESLQQFPHRGSTRDDVRPGLRITNYKRRAVIAFDVDAEQGSILGVFYGGQNYEAILQGESGGNQ